MVRDKYLVGHAKKENKGKNKLSYPSIKASVLMSICNNRLLGGGVSIEINLLGWKNDKIKKQMRNKL